MTLSHPSWAKDVEIGTRALSYTGLAFTAAFAMTFGLWAAYAPLAAAAVAPGHVAAAGRNQRVQHLEGGIIQSILVREGDRVATGQILFVMDPTKAKAAKNRLELRLLTLNAQAMRLMAERESLPTLTFDPAFQEAARGLNRFGILDEQEKEFTIRLQRYEQERQIMRQRVVALNDQITGLEAQKTAVETQLAVVKDESRRKYLLLQKGLTDRSEYTLLLRSEADLVGQLGQATSSILSSKTQIVEAEVQFARLTTQRIEAAASELNQVRSDISDADEQIAEAKSVLARVEVRSPSDGVVLGLNYNTPGSVVQPGSPMLDLLPTSQALEIDARISPADIDVIHIGQDATLRFSALNSRTTPVVDGTISYISADRMIDPETKAVYYTARLKIAEELPPEVKRSDIYPGMPVETYIKTGDRTFVDYLVKPISDSFNRAFRQE